MPKRLRAIAVILVLAGSVVAYIYCGKAPPGKGKGASPAKAFLKVARNYWPGQYWKEIAAKKGWFAGAGLDVELIDTNADYYRSLADMAEGRMDVNAFPLSDFLAFCLKGFDPAAVLNTDTYSGIDGIAAARGAMTSATLWGESSASWNSPGPDCLKKFYPDYIK